MKNFSTNNRGNRKPNGDINGASMIVLTALAPKKISIIEAMGNSDNELFRYIHYITEVVKKGKKK